MKFTIAILASTISAAMAYPTLSTRQSGCQIDQFGPITVIAAAESSSTTRWDIFTVNGPGISQGDLVFIENGNPNGNEQFTATAAGPSLFTFQRVNGEQVGLSGAKLLGSQRPTTLKVTCDKCNALATGNDNDEAAAGCTFETTDGTNGLGQCMTFTGAPATAVTTACDQGDPNQQFIIFTV